MKKILAMVLALCMMLSLTAAVADGFKTIEEGKLTYATSPDFPPFEGRDEDDTVIGIEPDILTLIGEKLGLEVEAVPMDFTSALLAAQTGKTDLVVSGVTATGEKAEERKKVFDFTNIYVYVQQAIVFKDGKDISMDNLGEQSIGVQAGTTGQDLTQEDFGEEKVTAYDTYPLAFQALLNDQIDCVVMDDAVAKNYVAKNPGLVMVQTTYDPEGYAFGVYKENDGLLDAINGALQELIDDGTVDKIITEWYSKEE